MKKRIINTTIPPSYFETYDRCPYCNNNKGSILKVNDIFMQKKCGNCGLTHLSPRLSKEGIKAYISKFNKELKHSDEVQTMPILDNEKQFIQKNLKPGRILDVGAYNGDLIRYMQHPRADCIGIEPIKKLCSAGMINSFYDESILTRLDHNSFDIIFFRESLYYMPDLKETFEITKKLLKPRGLIYIKSHAGDSPYYLFKKDFMGRSGSYMSCMFTRESLKKIISLEGFEIVAEMKTYLGKLTQAIGREDGIILIGKRRG